MQNRSVEIVVNQDGAAILDMERGLLSLLNRTGLYVFEGIQRGDRIDSLISGLVFETGQDIEIVDRDVREFVQELRVKGLIASI